MSNETRNILLMGGFILIAVFGSIYVSATVFGVGAGAKSITGYIGYTNQTTAKVVAGSSYLLYSTNQNLVSPTQLSCSGTNISPQAYELSQYYDPTNAGKFTAVSGQTVSWYPQTANSRATNGNTIVSGSVPVLSSSLTPCGQYLITSGDQSTYFLNYTYFNQLGSNFNYVYLNTPRYSAMTLTSANTSSATPTTTSRVHSTTATTPYTSYIFLKGGTYTSGEGGQVVSISYNSLAFTQVNINGLNQCNPVGGVPAISFVTSNTNEAELNKLGVQNTQLNYCLPPSSYNQYATGTIQAQGLTSQSATGAYAVNFQTLSTYASNEVISVQVTPLTDFFNNVNGTMMIGVARNPLTAANLFTPVSTANAIIVQYGT